MSENEKKYYLNIQAGANQSQNLAALMRNYGTAIDATNTALDSAGSAAEENARYMDSLEGELHNLKSAWENFSRTMVNSDLVKDGIDALTKALDFLATDAGQNIIKLGVAFGGVYLAAKPFIGLFKGTSALKNMSKFAGITRIATKELKNGKKHIEGTTKGFTKLTRTAGRATPEIVGMTAGLGSLHTLLAVGGVGFGLLGAAGITAGILALNKAIDGTEDPAKKYKQLKDEIGKLKDKIAGYNEEIQKLEEKGGKGNKKLSGAEKQRLEWLKEQTAELKEQVELREKLAKEEKQKKIEQPQGKDSKVQTKVKGTAAAVGKGSSSILKQMEDSTVKQKGYTDELITSVKHWQEGVASVGREAYRTGKVNQDSAKNFKDELEKVKKKQKDVIDTYGGFDKLPPKLQKSYKAAQDVEKGYKGIQKTLGKLGGEDWSTLTDKQVKKATSSFKQLGEAIGVSVDESGDLKSIDYSSFIGGLQSAGFTADQTKDALIQLGEENPDVKINVEGTEVAGKDIAGVIDFMDKLNSTNADATVDIDGTDVAVKDIKDVDTYLKLVNGTLSVANLSINGSEESVSKASAVKGAITNIPQGKNSKLGISGAEKSTKKASSLDKAIRNIPQSKVPQVRASVHGERKVDDLKTKINNVPSFKSIVLSVGASISGAAQKLMTKLGFAKGTKNAPEGLAEVNEQGYEFIRDAKTGKLRIAGGGKRTVTHLNEGDIVYTHAESKRMVADGNDIMIPQHKSGTKKKQKKYEQARDKILKQYDDKIDEKEHLAKVKHWTDEGLQKQKEKVWNAFNKKLKAENKKWKGVKLTKSLGRERLYSKTEGRADISHDKAVTAIDNAIEELSRKKLTEANIKNAKAVVDKYKKKKWISADEQKEYEKQIDSLKTEELSDKTKSSIETKIKNLDYDSSNKAIKKIKSAINKAYKKGKITAQEKAEYYEQIDEYQREQKSNKAKQEIDNAIEGITNEQSLKAVQNQIKQAAKSKLITAEEKEELLKQAKEKQQEYEHETATKDIENFLSGSRGTNDDFAKAKAKIQEAAKKGSISAEEREEYLKEAYKQNADYNMKMFQNGKVTYDNMQKMIKQYYNEGKLTAAEYYEYIEQLAQEQFEKEKERIEKQKQANDDKYSLAKAYVNRQIKLLQNEEDKQEKENRLQEEQNNLIEAQNNLMKAKSKLVKVYREGYGFVYEEDKEAIKEATEALKEQQKVFDETKKEMTPDTELGKWQSILDMFDEAEELASIKELENKVGGTAAGLFGGMGTDINKWTMYIKDSLAQSLGLSSIIDAMNEITDYTDMLNYLQSNGTVAQSKINAAVNQNRFASGTLNAPNGLARVAEQGYEIALLGKGDAVMPHNVSKNLMDWGAYNPHDFAKAIGSEGKQVSYNFDKLVLPNVSNANDFIRELNKLPNKALQFGTSRV